MSAPENPSAAEASVRRTVRVGSMPYRDPQGVRRRADAGTVVEVHPDDVDRFDRLNVLAGEVWERDMHGNLVQVHTPDPTSETPSPYPPTDAVAATENASVSVPETDAEKKAPRKAPAKKAAAGGSE